MKKHLVIVVIVVILLTVGLSGCFESSPTTPTIPTIQVKLNEIFTVNKLEYTFTNFLVSNGSVFEGSFIELELDIKNTDIRNITTSINFSKLESSDGYFYSLGFYSGGPPYDVQPGETYHAYMHFLSNFTIGDSILVRLYMSIQDPITDLTQLETTVRANIILDVETSS